MSNNETWAIVEIMGHNKMAGRYSFENGLHRVDVPTDDLKKFHTKLVGTGSIYMIHFCDEDAARMMARQFAPKPIGTWELKQEMARLQAPARPGEPVEVAGNVSSDDDDWMP